MNTDKKIFKKIVDDLLPYDTMKFVKNHPFEYPFGTEKIKLLYEFENKKNDSSFRFSNAELEQKKKKLVNNIMNFNDLLLSTTIVDERENRVILAAIRKDSKKSNRISKRLGQSADKVWDSYRKLIKTGEKKGFNTYVYLPYYPQKPVFGKSFLTQLVNYYF